MSKQSAHHKYWRANVTLVLALLAVWFLFSCVLSIFLVEPLNRIRLGGFPLGFWIAQQGSTIVFIGLVWAYAWRMRRLDRKHGVEEEATPR
jgi:putative solute:sodium symporter small subunit